MALKLVKGKVLPIGVDLGASALKLAQLQIAPDNPELLAVATADLPDEFPADMHERLAYYGQSMRQLVAEHAFKGRDAVLSVPTDATFVHHVKVPKCPPERLKSAVLQELKGKLPFPAARAEVRHVVAGDVVADGEARQEVIVVAVARETIDAMVSAARKARLRPVGVNIDACAIVECFARLFRRTNDQKRAILFLDIGQASTQVVLSHGKRIAFARNLSVAGAQLDAAAGAGLGISIAKARETRRALAAGESSDQDADALYAQLNTPLNALADELTQCLRYYESVFHTQSIERVIFLGGQATDKRLCQAVAQRLNLPAQIGDPLVRIATSQSGGVESGLDRRQPQPRWAVAVGLSLGAVA